jgi:transposase
VRTWARRGQTPVLQYHFNWSHLSVIAGITFWNFYFRLCPGSVGAEELIEFLKHLQRHIHGKLLIVWDKLPAHRSRAVRDYLAGRRGRVEMQYLPSYAPELNPVEYIWGHLKHHELPNVCPKDLSQLQCGARQALGRMRRRPSLIAAFWKQSSLWPE